jgi:hypothetical protein
MARTLTTCEQRREGSEGWPTVMGRGNEAQDGSSGFGFVPTQGIEGQGGANEEEVRAESCSNDAH